LALSEKQKKNYNLSCRVLFLSSIVNCEWGDVVKSSICLIVVGIIELVLVASCGGKRSITVGNVVDDDGGGDFIEWSYVGIGVKCEP